MSVSSQSKAAGLTEGSDSQEYMAALWSEVIGVDHLEPSDTFLDVGGNSLTLQVIVNRLQKEKGRAPRAELFYDPDRSSVAALASELDRLLAEGPATDDEPPSTARC